MGEGLRDPLALATWYEALSSALGPDLPHELLALWLYPAEGGAVLLGPAALVEDELAVPVPAPHLPPSQVAALEEIVRDAGYGSVLALPIRFGRRDVGLLLVADLRPDRYGERERVLLQSAAQRLAPMLGRLARLWASGGGGAPSADRVAALVEAVGQANALTESPQLFARGVSRALELLVPHDHLELLVPDPSEERWFRLGEHGGGPIWSDLSLVITREFLDVGRLFEPTGTLLVPDTYADPRWPRGYFTAAEPAGAELRAIAGASIAGLGGPMAYLLLGSVGPDLYGPEDAELLLRVGRLIRPRVEAFAQGALAPLRGPPGAAALGLAGAAAPGDVLAGLAALLATERDVPQALQDVALAATRLIAYDQLRIALRLADGDRVVLLEPGERRPLPDLPLHPVVGTAVASVLRGEAAWVREAGPEESRLIVPLRVAGQIHGALVFTARRAAAFGEPDAVLAQRLADVLAPHLELLRRAAVTPPFAPGWKRSGLP